MKNATPAGRRDRNGAFFGAVAVKAALLPWLALPAASRGDRDGGGVRWVSPMDCIHRWHGACNICAWRFRDALA